MHRVASAPLHYCVKVASLPWRNYASRELTLTKGSLTTRPVRRWHYPCGSLLLELLRVPRTDAAEPSAQPAVQIHKAEVQPRGRLDLHAQTHI